MAATALGETAAADAPSLARGALLGVANPKSWVAIAAVFTSAHLADIAAMLREPRRARVVNAALALVLNECACAYCASIKRHYRRLS